MSEQKPLYIFTEVGENGGIEVMSKNLLSNIKNSLGPKEKINVILLKNEKKPFQDPKIDFYCCGSSLKYLRRLKFIYHLKRLLPKSKFIFSNHINLLRPIANSLNGIKYGFMAYGIDIFEMDALSKKIAKNACFIIPISKYTFERIMSNCPEAKIPFIFPPGVDGGKFKPASKNPGLMKKYGIQKGDKVILTVSRLSAKEGYKGYDKIIRILPSLVRRYPSIKYLIVGKGDDSSRIKNLADKLHLKNNFALCGFVEKEQLVSYYNLCDVFVMPSTSEGFGIVFIEALSCGKPVIAGNVDGSVDALQDGKTGILVNPNNMTEIKNALEAALEKKIKKNFLDPLYLREHTLSRYGDEKFRVNSKRLMDSIKKCAE